MLNFVLILNCSSGYHPKDEILRTSLKRCPEKIGISCDLSVHFNQRQKLKQRRKIFLLKFCGLHYTRYRSSHFKKDDLL